MVKEGAERLGKELPRYTKSPAEDATLTLVISRLKTTQVLPRTGRRRDTQPASHVSNGQKELQRESNRKKEVT